MKLIRALRLLRDITDVLFSLLFSTGAARGSEADGDDGKQGEDARGDIHTYSHTRTDTLT